MFSGLTSAGTALPAASIRAEVQDPGVGSSAMGGRLVFATTQQGQTSPTDWLVLDNMVRIG